MLEKITEFFRTFLKNIFGGLRSLFLPKDKESIVIVEPDPEDLVPQDGGDIPQDTIVTIDTNLEEVVIVPDVEETPPPRAKGHHGVRSLQEDRWSSTFTNAAPKVFGGLDSNASALLERTRRWCVSDAARDHLRKASHQLGHGRRIRRRV